MTSGIQGFAASLQNGFVQIFEKGKAVRKEPDAFLKVSQVALAALQLGILYNPALSTFSRLAFTLRTASMHDFYSFILRPKQFFLPVTADAIDVERIYCIFGSCVRSDSNPSLEDKDKDIEVAGSVSKSLGAFLEKMRDTGHSYRNAGKFVEGFEHHLCDDARYSAMVMDSRVEEAITKAFKQIKEDPDCCLRRPTLAARMANWNWVCVDFGCAALYLQGWNLLDTAKWAARLGQFRLLAWVPNQALDRWVVGSVAVGFALNLFESLRKLHDEPLDAEATRREKWQAVAACGESLLWGAIWSRLVGALPISEAHIHGLTLAVKSLGLAVLAFKPPSRILPSWMEPSGGI